MECKNCEYKSHLLKDPCTPGNICSSSVCPKVAVDFVKQLKIDHPEVHALFMEAQKLQKIWYETNSSAAQAAFVKAHKKYKEAYNKAIF